MEIDGKTKRLLSIGGSFAGRLAVEISRHEGAYDNDKNGIEEKPEPKISYRVVTNGTGEHKMVKSAEMIVRAFKNGDITEAQARLLMSRI